MSEAKKSFMEELDEWVEHEVFEPYKERLWINFSDPESPDCEECREATEAEIKKAIRQKVLDSYRNGLKAPARAKPEKGARPWK